MNRQPIIRSISYLYLMLILLFLYFPLIVVCVFSFNSGRYTTKWSGFTLEWYIKLFNNEGIMKALVTSLVLSLIVTALSVIIGTLCCIALHRIKIKYTKYFIPVIHLPVLTPEIIIGIAFLQIFSIINVKFGMITLILSHLSFCVPFVIIVVSARLKSLPENLEDAARDLGANQWQALWHITIPELMPGILSGAALAFLMSFDDVIISFFMSGATNTTLPVKVYSMLRVGISPEINALTTITIFITIICVLILNINKFTKKA